jgi:WD40 repeat protein
MSVDSHTEFEATTLVYALLKEFDESMADEFYESAFKHEQLKENARGVLASLPPQFIPSLIQSSCPETTFRSIIQNPGPFPKSAQERKSKLIYDRLKMIVIAYRLVGHKRPVHQIALDPLNLLFFTGDAEAVIKCWHVPSMSLIRTFKGHDEDITGLAMSVDRRLLMSWSEDKLLRLWSLLDGAAVAAISLFDADPIKSAAFSPCGRFLAAISGGATGQVRVLRIAKFAPCLAAAARALGADGKLPYGSTVGELLFPDGNYSLFDEYDPYNFLKQPPKIHKQCHLKSPGSFVAFSAGGNFVACALTNGSVIILSMSTQRRWSLPQAHEAAVDGMLFMKHNFHLLLTWSQRGGDIKLWKFHDKTRPLVVFTVRTASRRAHLVSVSVSCDETLLYGCSSQSLFAWRIDSQTPILHSDDACLSLVTDVCASPVLPHICMAITRSLITIWDVCEPTTPIHQLIIPVETPRIQTGRWGPDGLSVIASDAAGGIYVFKVGETPECRIMPQFFETDFTPSAWFAEHGQLEESNGLPVHRQSRAVLLDERNVEIYRDFKPYSFDELTVIPLVSPELKYTWLREEIWVRSLGAKDSDEKKGRGPARGNGDTEENEGESEMDGDGESSDREPPPGFPASNSDAGE